MLSEELSKNTLKTAVAWIKCARQCLPEIAVAVNLTLHSRDKVCFFRHFTFSQVISSHLYPGIQGDEAIIVTPTHSTFEHSPCYHAGPLQHTAASTRTETLAALYREQEVYQYSHLPDNLSMNGYAPVLVSQT
jgi:hypothetical protein